MKVEKDEKKNNETIQATINTFFSDMLNAKRYLSMFLDF